VHESPAKIVRVYHYEPGKQVFLGSVLMKDVPGALGRIALELSNHKLNLVGSSSSSINGSGIAEWGFFAVGENGPMSADGLQTAIGGMPDVVHCEIKEGKDGLIVDDLHYPLKLNTGQQAMIVRRDTFSDMFERLRFVLGTGGRVVIFQLGVATGQNAVKDHVHSIGKEAVLANARTLSDMYLAQGWGRLEVVQGKAEPFEVVFRLYDSFECKGASSEAPNSDFMRGYVTGYIKSLFKKNVMCTEVHCVATGHDYCEFLVTER